MHEQQSGLAPIVTRKDTLAKADIPIMPDRVQRSACAVATLFCNARAQHESRAWPIRALRFEGFLRTVSQRLGLSVSFEVGSTSKHPFLQSEQEDSQLGREVSSAKHHSACECADSHDVNYSCLGNIIWVSSNGGGGWLFNRFCFALVLSDSWSGLFKDGDSLNNY